MGLLQGDRSGDLRVWGRRPPRREGSGCWEGLGWERAATPSPACLGAVALWSLEEAGVEATEVEGAWRSLCRGTEGRSPQQRIGAGVTGRKSPVGREKSH